MVTTKQVALDMDCIDDLEQLMGHMIKVVDTEIKMSIKLKQEVVKGHESGAFSTGKSTLHWDLPCQRINSSQKA